MKLKKLMETKPNSLGVWFQILSVRPWRVRGWAEKGIWRSDISRKEFETILQIQSVEKMIDGQ